MADKAALSEGPLDADDLRRLLIAATSEKTAILVGGQALAFWLLYFGIFDSDGDHSHSITRDADFFVPNAARTDFVAALARAIQGVSDIPHERALTALVGRAIRFTSETSYINADVIFTVVGVNATELQRHAITVHVDGVGDIRVMDPITVLQSRIENLHRLRDKQNAKGVEQGRLAVLLATRYLEEARKLLDARPSKERRDPMLKLVGRVEQIAESAAGRAVAKRYGVHPADAISPQIVNSPEFHKVRLPQLANFMSESRRIELGLASQPIAQPPCRPRRP